jgi:hypothetical protein
MIHLRLGGKEKARAELSRALTLGPISPILQGDTARKALDRLTDPQR